MDFQVQLERALGGSAGARHGGGRAPAVHSRCVPGVRCSRLTTGYAVLFGDVSLLT